jgi:hypothetical protein
MKKSILTLIVLSSLLFSCKKEPISGPVNEPKATAGLQKNGPKTKKARAFGEPIFGKNTLPPEITIVTTVILDSTEFNPKEYNAISNASLILDMKDSDKEEYSKIKGGKLELELLSFNPKTGEMKFGSKLLEFKYLFPEKSYTALGTLTLNYSYSKEKENGNGSVIVKEKTEKESYNLGDIELITPRLGKPFLIEITRAKDGKIFSYLMYASGLKEIDALFNELVEFKAGMAKMNAKELSKIPNGLEEINPYYNVKNLHLVSIESDVIVIGKGSNPKTPWYYDPSWASFGIGTRSTASIANNKAELL